MPGSTTEFMVAELVARHAGVSPEMVTPRTRLTEDLLIVGDDADELIDELSTKFDIDMAGYCAENYFPEEASSEMHYHLVRFKRDRARNVVGWTVFAIESWFWRKLSKPWRYKTITVGDLVTIAESRKWR